MEKFLGNEEAVQNEKEKEKLKLRLDVVQEIKRAFNWGIATEENKQSKRILQLAMSRRQDIDVTDQIKEINLYSKIRETIPYVMAVSYNINLEEKHLTEDLLEFCEKQLEIIDSSPYKSKIVFPTKEEVEIAFKSYTERIKPNKIPSLKVYKQPEVNEKIEELYQMFLSVTI
ncbi:hypothetical protein M601_016025 [Cellulophaga baltica 4]|nr:hypothetical protein M601_016025 [Cellulophaga baltica 4]